VDLRGVLMAVEEKPGKQEAQVFPRVLREGLVQAADACIKAAGDRNWKGNPPAAYQAAVYVRDKWLMKIRVACPELFREDYR
jgi:hypothetical protein